MKTALVIAALLVAAQPALADVEGTCVETVCGSQSHHPGATYPCDQACQCMDECGGASGGGGNGQAGAAMVEGMVKLIGYTVGGIAFLIMPGHMAEATSKNAQHETSEQARAEWNKVVEMRDSLIDAGKQADKSRKALWKLDEQERAELRDGSNDKKKKVVVPKPFDPPKLKPDLGFQCRGAIMQLGAFHNEGSIGKFPSEGAMVAQCGQFAPDPQAPDAACTQGSSRPCGLNPEVCCPNGSPLYNSCDGQCYSEWNFIKSPAGDAGLHCQPRECGALLKP